MFFVRQGATHKLVVGPAVAVGDGFTPVTTLAISSADEAEAILHDNGTVVDIAAYTWAAITTADGYYHLTLQSGISNTVGHVTIVINDDSLILPIKAEYTVLEEAVYDQLYAASAPGAASQASVDTIDDFLDTEIAAILAAVDTEVAAILADTDAMTTTGVTLANDAITAAKFDESTAFPLKSDDSGSTQVARTGADADTLETLSDQIDGVSASALVVASGTIGSTGNDTTHLHLDGLTQGDDELNDLLIVVFDNSTSEYHSRWILDWVISTELATVAALPFTPEDATDTYVILAVRQDVTGGSGLDAAGVRAALGFASASYDTDISGLNTKLDTIDDFLDTEIASIIAAIDTEVAAILADTDELQTDWANGGRLDLLLDATLADTNELQGDWTNGGRLDLIIDSILDDTDLIDDGTSGLAKIATDVAAILVDTGTTLDGKLNTIDDFLDTEVAAILAAVDTEVAAILVDTGTDIPATLAALFTTALTESYRGTGATGTVSQLLYELLANLVEHANTGTTRTAKKLDGSTTAKTYTYDDDTNPTSITETT